MRDDLTLIVMLGVDECSLDQIEDQKVDRNEESEEMIEIVLLSKHAHRELRLVDVVAHEQIPLMLCVGHQGQDCGLVHGQAEVSV